MTIFLLCSKVWHHHRRSPARSKSWSRNASVIFRCSSAPKVAREHRVPLSDPALTLLTQQRDRTKGDFVWEGYRRDRPVSLSWGTGTLHSGRRSRARLLFTALGASWVKRWQLKQPRKSGARSRSIAWPAKLRYCRPSRMRRKLKHFNSALAVARAQQAILGTPRRDEHDEALARKPRQARELLAHRRLRYSRRQGAAR